MHRFFFKCYAPAFNLPPPPKYSYYYSKRLDYLVKTTRKNSFDSVQWERTYEIHQFSEVTAIKFYPYPHFSSADAKDLLSWRILKTSLFPFPIIAHLLMLFVIFLIWLLTSPRWLWRKRCRMFMFWLHQIDFFSTARKRAPLTIADLIVFYLCS